MEFRRLGHALVDRIADYLEQLPDRAIVPSSVEDVRAMVQQVRWSDDGEPLDDVVGRAAALLLDHSVITSHPRFWGYINGAASPLAALGDLLGTIANPNASAWYVGPATSAIEEQAVQWLGELVGYRAGSSGLLVSGGSMANLSAIAVARKALVGTRGASLRIFATAETHTWLAKAEAFLGLTAAIHTVPTEDDGRMSLDGLRAALAASPASPTIVVANAGTTSTGAVDPIEELGALCDDRGYWLHVDGAYGAPAACVPTAPTDLHHLGRASSLVLDPHKWLYTSFEAGCLLVRSRQLLVDTFAHGSPYYAAGSEALPHYRDLGPQTSRGARAVKVWMCLLRAGRAGYRRMIADDIELARRLHERVSQTPQLEALTHNLSITTFRFLPGREVGDAEADAINDEIVRRLQVEGVAYPSRTVVRGRVAIRVCIVNFRTQPEDVDRLPGLVCELGGRIVEEHRANRSE